MKIDTLSISEQDEKTTGLKANRIDFRSSMILLAGKNGSEKTRLLKLIKGKIFAHGAQGLSKIPKYMESKNAQLYNLYKQYLVLHYTPEIIRNIQVNLANSKKTANFDFDDIIESAPQEFGGNELDLLVGTAINHFYKFPTIYLLKKATYSSDQDRNWRATKVYQRFNSLKSKFELFLGKNLECIFDDSLNKASYAADGSASGIKGTWLLDGFPIKYENLSDGEKTLVSYILLFYLQEQYPYSKAKDSIILIDEPETHLQPQAQIKLIKGLMKLTEDYGQLIVATHSIPILSICNSDSIYFLKNSEIFSPGSRIPNEVLEDLIGVEEISTHIRPLLTNASEWAFNTFLLNCFQSPEVIEKSNSRDPQFNQLLNFLVNNETLRILDFGAGKGRLETLIHEGNLTKYIFDAYDPSSENEPFLSNHNGIENYFKSLKDINTSYDVIIVCNVLHEIEPTKWVKTINGITKLLSKGGFLLVLEDLQLRKGECPHEYGYLVLNQDELVTLLNYQSIPDNIKPHQEIYDNRLLCCAFRKEDIRQVKTAQVVDAIDQLAKRSFISAIDQRNDSYYKNGRTYAFYAQQYINAIYTLKKINSL